MTEQNFDIPLLLNQLEIKLKLLVLQRQLHDPVMIGLYSGGVWVAKELHHRLAIKEPLALMDVSFYRDDFSQVGMHLKTKPSQIPLSLEGRDIILVDDVFYTGRTVRAALNEIFDFGRPHQIVLAVLIEREGQQIPLKPDCTGISLNLPKGIDIKLTGPHPLALHLQSSVSPV